MSIKDGTGALTSEAPVASVAVPKQVSQRAQPMVGTIGLLIVAVVFVILGLVWSPQTSLVVLGPITTFALPVLALCAIWWGGWPFAKSGRSVSGLANTVMIVVIGLVLTGVGLLIVGHFNVKGIFSANAAAQNSKGVLTTFPFTVPIAAAVFVAMLQLTFVSGKWPLHKMRPASSGFAALLLSWVIGTAAYFLATNWNSVPVAARTALGIRNGVGPMNAIDFTALLLCIVVYQMGFFVLFKGWPFAGIKNTGARLIASHLGTIAGGWITFFVLLNGFKWHDPVIVGVCGSIIAAIFLVAMLFETWPFQDEEPSGNRLGAAILAVVVTCCLYFGLRALGQATGTWSQAPVELWIGVSGLNYIAAVVILHYAVWGRWPLEPPMPPPG
ncbi:MAG: hypothetical protein EPN30_04830 [Actinomycetota bacterium]|nr:MAG: hypothetical protein EPN30_04830 [Actinomycetota bacterium]